MKGISVCHYSYHRTWKAEGWDCDALAAAVKDLGVGAVDFHAGLLGSPDEAPARIRSALEKTGLAVSGLSMSNNFNAEEQEVFEQQVETVKVWLRVAAEVGAPVSRIFGGHLKDRTDQEMVKAAIERVQEGLALVAREAERLGVVLALENHGGLPCLPSEQVLMIETINSPNLRATVDLGNYMAGGVEGHVALKETAAYAAYVHVKDNDKVSSSETPWGWKPKGTTIGQGDVDIPACLRELRAAGYDGWLALEYEGQQDEKAGIPESIAYMKKAMAAL